MSCNSCAKPYSLLRKEKGCSNCGYSYCSKCLNDKVFVPKLNSQSKVCAKCKKILETNEPQQKVIPPDAYYKRLGVGSMSGNSSVDGKETSTTSKHNSKDQEILERLRKLKEDSEALKPSTTEEEIAKRLQKIKGEIPTTTDEELRERLAKLRGVPISTLQSQAILPTPETRSEQEQADDLLKQYMAQSKIDANYTDEFNSLISTVESRLNKLKSSDPAKSDPNRKPTETTDDHSEDEEDAVRKIVERVKAESAIEEDEIAPSTHDELPFCEICNEDARMRCLGCRYLFCKRCFLEHNDDDDGCNRYEPYSPPKNI